jgi:hypothetical protein
LPTPDYTYYACYRTLPINQIFSATTSNLDQNVYLKYPLHFVNNRTQRLFYRYSLLVKQYSLTEQSFNYWEKLKGNNQNSGGLYDSQPQKVMGNVVCITNPNEEVLGYFGVSSVSSHRIFVTRNDLHQKLIYDQNLDCVQWQPTRWDFVTNSSEETWPVYLAPPPEDKVGLWYAPKWCIDCRLEGGTLEIPEFWSK